MKKWVKRGLLIFAALVVLLVVAFVLWLFLVPRSGVPDQADVYADEDGWHYAYREKWDNCVVLSWQWDGDEDNMTVTIPETLGGRTVTSLSQKDTILSPFEVKMPEELSSRVNASTEDEECVAAGDTYDTYVFHIVLNDNIKYVGCMDTWYSVMDDDGNDNVLYKIEYVFD